jgi:hypothetical protein
VVDLVLAGHVRRHVRDHDVDGLAAGRLADDLADAVAGVRLGHVAPDGLDAGTVGLRQRLDPLAVDADHGAGVPDRLGGDLEPAARRGPQVDDRVAGAEQAGRLVQLLELVGRAGAVPLLFRLVVVVVFIRHRYLPVCFEGGLSANSQSHRDDRGRGGKTCRSFAQRWRTTPAASFGS